MRVAPAQRMHPVQRTRSWGWCDGQEGFGGGWDRFLEDVGGVSQGGHAVDELAKVIYDFWFRLGLLLVFESLESRYPGLDGR